MANVITTLLRMDATQLRTGLRGAQQAIRETDGTINKAKAGWAAAFAGFASSPVAIGAATAAVGAFAAQSVSAASDLEESINAVNVTFGESADKILEFGDNAAKSVGLAKSEFNQLATPLGSILKNAGFSLDETADKTITLTQRAADMASVFNTDVSDALGAIQAGLRGEQDPRFGVGLSAARVEARALADTGKDSAKALTEQEKALARVELILDQTNQTAGDFAETSDSLANQTRILKAEYKDLQAAIGAELIPILSDAAGVLLDIRDNAVKAKNAIEDIPGGPGLLDALGTNLFELPRKSKEEWDELGRKIGIIPDETSKAIVPTDRLKTILEGTGGAIDGVSQGVERSLPLWREYELGLREVNAEAEGAPGNIDAVNEALEEMAQAAEDRAAAALGTLANAIQGVRDALDTAFGDLEGDLGALDLLDDIHDQFGEVQEAAEAMAEGGEDAARDYNREVRRLQGQLIDFLRTVENIPPDKQVEILAKIRTGDIATLEAVLDELTRDRFINIGFSGQTRQAFDAVNGVFTPGQAPSAPIFTPAIPPSTIDARTINITYPIGSTPTTQFVDSQTDFRRNGIR